MIAELDLALARAVNAGVGASPLFDSLVLHASGNHLVKSLPPVAGIWFLWWNAHLEQPRRRATLLAAIAACFLAMTLVRLLGRLLPFRQRPILDPALGLERVADMPLGFLGDMSSMPSDHAGLFFALAVGLLAVSRAAGLAALAHAALFAVLPRLYLGLHYPSDLLVGALVGGASAWVLTRERVVARLGRPLLAAFETRPALAYATLFVVTSQLASMLDPLRGLLGWLRGMLHAAAA